MKLNEYQKKAMTTCLPSCENMSYMLLGLMSEVGEIMGKVKKAIRKREIYIDDNDLLPAKDIDMEIIKTLDTGLRSEVGDVLWYVAGLCYTMGCDLEDIAKDNLHKLSERKKNGTIIGNGDGTTKEERL